MRSQLLELGGIFLGGALPWLEAVVVIPIGIVAGLQPVAVVATGVAGNLVTVAVAALFGERIREWWRARRAATAATAADGPHDDAVSPRRARIERIFQRWGLLGLALVGPIGIGTQLSAVVAVALGTSASRTFAWVGAGTVLWAVAAGMATVAGRNMA